MGSGGINAQTAIRDNRLFNDRVTSASSLTFYETGLHTFVHTDLAPTVPKLKTPKLNAPIRINLSDLLVNVNTTTTDKFGLKAAGQNRYEQRCLKVTRVVQEHKKEYGEIRRLKADANATCFFVGLEYPSKALRMFMTAPWKGS